MFIILGHRAYAGNSREFAEMKLSRDDVTIILITIFVCLILFGLLLWVGSK